MSSHEELARKALENSSPDYVTASNEYYQANEAYRIDGDMNRMFDCAVAMYECDSHVQIMDHLNMINTDETDEETPSIKFGSAEYFEYAAGILEKSFNNDNNKEDPSQVYDGINALKFFWKANELYFARGDIAKAEDCLIDRVTFIRIFARRPDQQPKLIEYLTVALNRYMEVIDFKKKKGELAYNSCYSAIEIAIELKHFDIVDNILNMWRIPVCNDVNDVFSAENVEKIADGLMKLSYYVIEQFCVGKGVNLGIVATDNFQIAIQIYLVTGDIVHVENCLIARADLFKKLAEYVGEMDPRWYDWLNNALQGYLEAADLKVKNSREVSSIELYKIAIEITVQMKNYDQAIKVLDFLVTVQDESHYRFLKVFLCLKCKDFPAAYIADREFTAHSQQRGYDNSARELVILWENGDDKGVKSYYKKEELKHLEFGIK